MIDPDLTRRRLLQAGMAAGAAAALGADARAAVTTTDGLTARALWPSVLLADFTKDAAAPGWGPRWRCTSAANLLRTGREAVLEAGSDVFPNDPRPAAFALDARVRDSEVRARVTRVGAGVAVALRRVSPRDYYAALFDAERGVLAIVRRRGSDLRELATLPALPAGTPFELTLSATGANPTRLRATLGATELTASDASPALQVAGDPAVLGTARTFFPSAGVPGFPALGNLHLLPYGVQEGQAFLDTSIGQGLLAEIRRASTIAVDRVEVRSPDRPARTPPAVVAATTGAPVAGGGTLHVAADVRSRVTVEVGEDPGLRRARRIRAGLTGDFDALSHTVTGLRPGRRVYWRATLERHGVRQTGPVRSFRVPPAATDGSPVTIAVGCCGTQFGPIFDHLAAEQPDVFVWQGDLNYPDTHGPVAQTLSGYAGIWRDFLANPRLAPVLERTAFLAQRDDHDYGIQDANSTDIPPWGVAPWDALMSRRRRFRFRAGAAEVWVLDQRREKTDPAAHDDLRKTLLGPVQRRWLLKTLAASDAPLKIICSPCTVFMTANARDGNWSRGFTAERDLLLAHLRDHVSGRVVFVTGDTHLTGVYDRDGHLEVRAAPIDIPSPNDITLVDPFAARSLGQRPGVTYASDAGHFALLRVAGTGPTARLDVELVREDGVRPYRRRV